jgi:hypothetical protein
MSSGLEKRFSRNSARDVTGVTQPTSHVDTDFPLVNRTLHISYTRCQQTWPERGLTPPPRYARELVTFKRGPNLCATHYFRKT